MALPPGIRGSAEGTTVDIYVQPRSGRNEVVGFHEGMLKVRLTAPPVEGEANRECLRFMARSFGVPKSRVELVQGHKSRRKTILFRGIGLDVVEEVLRQLEIM